MSQAVKLGKFEVVLHFEVDKDLLVFVEPYKAPLQLRYGFTCMGFILSQKDKVHEHINSPNDVS